MSATNNLASRITASIQTPNALRALIPQIQVQPGASNLFGSMMVQAAHVNHFASYTLAANEYFRTAKGEPSPYDQDWVYKALDGSIEAGHNPIAEDLLDRRMANYSGEPEFKVFEDNVVLRQALQFAVVANNVEYVQWVLAKDFRPTSVLRLPIWRACVEGTVEILHLMLDRVREFIDDAWFAHDTYLDMQDAVLLFIGVLCNDDEFATDERLKPQMVLLLLPVYARVAHYLAEDAERAGHNKTMDQVRQLFQLDVHFSRDVPRAVKFASYSREDCLHVIAQFACQLPWGLIQGLSEHLRDPTLWPFDITVTVDGKAFEMHRDILGAWSRPFKKLLSTYWKDGRRVTIDGPTVGKEAFQELVQFMYSGRFDHTNQTEQQLRAIVDLADQFRFRSLQTQLEMLIPGLNS
ncbi:hypothetical protein BJY01DRAFT_247856 [Aspergillus pseudoustus]|uniref:BTB domain-containing protein n=1 Tax=Aspergillus pseudoustus TaxID=1810923 RepID=A0ABR4JZ02_9EURO